MSFSAEVKEELCRAPMARNCCAISECSGILLFSHTFTPGEIRIITSSRKFAMRAEKLFRKAFDVELEITEPKRDASREKFTLRCNDADKIIGVFDRLELDADTSVSHRINLGLLEESCCRCSFIRGAFLAGGSVTDPEKGYHLEFSGSHENVCSQFSALLRDMGFDPKETHRNGKPVNYFKKAAAIEDILTAAGAPTAAMKMMTVSADKDFRSEINRRVNCDSANADKIVQASALQLTKIRNIDRIYGIDALPEELQQVAMLRIANPEASLSDLSALSYPPVSKSGIAHRMRKIMSLELPDIPEDDDLFPEELL